MNLLIDGHNLIGQLPNLSLADPDDEAKLVVLLRSYAARHRCAITVIFDRGVVGHPQRLSGNGVTCRFAHSPQDADEQLLRRIAAIKQPRDWRIVTSDRAVARAATAHDIEVVDSATFARRLLDPAGRNSRKRAAAPLPRRERPLSDTEVDEWMTFLGLEEDRGS
ncbi:MAG TPA: NYN domain-containing protein [Roseiflexaceae bacterium]|nr:NYN domain-containing protein [Roseiflexaceae bacterium]HMP42331.1 NYN domain-containing protein [Roseiflexaceae bacterium]